MAAGRYSFTIEQGATFQLELQYKDANQTPINLTNYSGRMQIRPSAASSTVYLTLSSSLNSDGTGLNFSGSNNSTSPSSGSIGIYIASCTSSMLSFDGPAYYDLELYSGSAPCPFTIRLLEGQVQLSKEITRP
jgi:hypothetical protein